MKNRLLFYSIALAALILFASGCAMKAVTPVEIGDRSYRKRVLIATQQSTFKEVVVSGVLEELEKDPCYVRVIDLTKLEGETTEGYDVLVIVNTCRAWSLDHRVANFLQDAREKEKIIVLTTAGGEDWQPKTTQIDAITSASEMNKAGAVADAIVSKVRSRLALD